VERRLAAHGRQQRIGTFLLDDARNRAPVNRLDVDRIRDFRIGHDRGGIRVHQHDAETLLAQRLAGLHAGVVEFRRLADDNRTRADDQDGFDVGSFGHVADRAQRKALRPLLDYSKDRLRHNAHAVAERFALFAYSAMSRTKRSNNGWISCGPGLLSGCPWKLNAGRSVSAIPCRLPSNSERCVAVTLAGSVASSTAKPWFWLVIITLPDSRSITG